MKALPSWKLSAKTWPPNRLFKHTKLFYQITQEPLHEPPSNNLLTKIPNAGWALCHLNTASPLQPFSCYLPIRMPLPFPFHLLPPTPPTNPPSPSSPPQSTCTYRSQYDLFEAESAGCETRLGKPHEYLLPRHILGPSHAMDWKVHLRRADPVRHLRKLGF